jgi:hypothetical protein
MSFLGEERWLEAAGEALPPDEREHDLDFWIGEWELTWDGGSTRNIIRPILGGRALLETFDGGPAVDLRGISVSAWDRLRGEWVQLWVDNTGNAFDLHGGLRGESFELRTEPDADGLMRRMLFSDISADGLDWEWSRGAPESGWQPLWQVRYRRLV